VISVWFDTGRPVCHVEVHANRPIGVTARYETWCTAERELTYGHIGDGERIAAASYVCYRGKVMTFPDTVETTSNAVTVYHRNRDDKLLFDFLMQQDLEAVKSRFWNPQKGLTFGGRLSGDHSRFARTSSGEYANFPFKAYELESTPARSHHFTFCAQTSQEPSVDAWKAKLDAVSRAAADPAADANAKRWWAEFWKRSWIDINADKNDKDTGSSLPATSRCFVTCWAAMPRATIPRSSKVGYSPSIPSIPRPRLKRSPAETATRAKHPTTGCGAAVSPHRTNGWSTGRCSKAATLT
jgi:hypothetical protein